MGSDSEPPVDPSSLRLAGLRAFLLRDVDTAVAAWTEYEALHDQTHHPDPFVAAALGLLYLVEDQPARAYPRLRDAVQAFPGVGFLTVYLADAAVQCGDLAEARRLLDRARALPRRDAQCGLERVEADLAVAEGRTEEAERLYRQVMTKANPIARFSLAQLLERTGRLKEAVHEYSTVCGHVPNAAKPREAFVACADRWWAEQSVAQRRALMRSALDENPFAPGSFVGLLRTYVECAGHRTTASAHRPGGTADNSPAFQRWGNQREFARSPGGTTEGTSAVPEGTGMVAAAPNPSDESLGYSHSVPPARTSFRLFDFSIFRLFKPDFPALGPLFFAHNLQRVTLTQLAHILEVHDMARWSRIRSYPRILKELQFWAWLSLRRQAASQAIDWAYQTWTIRYRSRQFIRLPPPRQFLTGIFSSSQERIRPTNTHIAPSRRGRWNRPARNGTSDGSLNWKLRLPI